MSFVMVISNVWNILENILVYVYLYMYIIDYNSTNMYMIYIYNMLHIYNSTNMYISNICILAPPELGRTGPNWAMCPADLLRQRPLAGAEVFRPRNVTAPFVNVCMLWMDMDGGYRCTYLYNSMKIL